MRYKAREGFRVKISQPRRMAGLLASEGVSSFSKSRTRHRRPKHIYLYKKEKKKKTIYRRHKGIKLMG